MRSKIKQIYQYIYYAPIFLLVIASSIKNDFEGFLMSRHWAEFTNGPLILIIKQNINATYLVLAILLPIAFIYNGKPGLRLPVSASVFSLIYFFGGLRTLTTDPLVAVKFFVAFGVMAIIMIYMASLAERGRNVIGIVNSALLATATTLISLNVLEYATGNGYAPGFARFFGTSAHPNFIGVQMAICCLVVMGAYQGNSAGKKLLKAALLCGGILILFASGSRTALVIFATGFIILQALTRRATTLALSGIILGACVILLVFTSGSDLFSSEVYDRGGINTREGAWLSLLSDVTNNPFLGLGYFPAFAENSILRGWATIGIAYPILFLLSICIISSQFLKSINSINKKEISAVASVLTGIISGSILEGYMIDANSFPIYVWFVCLSALGIHIQFTRRHLIQKRWRPVTRGTLRSGAT